MGILRMVSCAALAAVMATAAIPAPGSAQIDRLIKRAARERITQAVVDQAARALGVQPDAGRAEAAANPSAHSGPTFTEHVLEMSPEVLDRFEQGLAAEAAVRQEVDRLVGKVLPRDEYDRCHQEVMTSPDAQEVLTKTADLMPENPSQEAVRKASEELYRRFDALVEARCGLEPVKASEVRGRHAARLEAAAPDASGLTRLQLSHMKERIVPLCTAIQASALEAGAARLPTGMREVFWVYSELEVEALRTRCGMLLTALRVGA
jgi:histone H3/H4